jgi:anti-sigma factor RsiW
MNGNSQSVREDELQAYIDGQLDSVRHAEVGRHIEQDPELAARIMTDLRIRDELRLVLGSPDDRRDGPVPIRTARRADRFPRLATRLAGIAAAGLVAVGGWVASDEWDLRNDGRAEARTPDFPVDEAVMSHKTALVRAKIYLDDRPRLNAAEVGRETKITLPRLPASWRVLDVQLFPSDVGPSMQVTLDTEGPGPPISLFAVRARTTAPQQPETVARDGETVAYWQEGDLAFALTGREPAAAMDAAAEDLADNALDGA